MFKCEVVSIGKWSRILYSNISGIIQGQRGLFWFGLHCEVIMVVVWKGHVCLEVRHGLWFTIFGQSSYLSLFWSEGRVLTFCLHQDM